MQDETDPIDSTRPKKKRRQDDSHVSGETVDAHYDARLAAGLLGESNQVSGPASPFDRSSLAAVQPPILLPASVHGTLPLEFGLGGLLNPALSLSSRQSASRLVETLLGNPGFASTGYRRPWDYDPRMQRLTSAMFPLSSPLLSSHIGHDDLALLGLRHLAGARPASRPTDIREILGLSQGNHVPFMAPPQTGVGSLVHENLATPLSDSLRAMGLLRGSENASRSGTTAVLSSSAAAPGPLPVSKRESSKGIATLLPIPTEGSDSIPYNQRLCVPLATDEDTNWLSEFLCFVRSDLVEVFRASEEDVRSRNSSKKVKLGQVGIRCRYCAYLPQSARASRSSSYPSSLSRIYQSLTMMLRDHFGSCSSIPHNVKQRFLALKGKTSQGATDSKQFWVYSGKKLGLIDTESGIWVDESQESQESNDDSNYWGTRPKDGDDKASTTVLLVSKDDRPLVSDFTYTLMTHAQLVHLEESERIGNRKNLPIGLPGVGCRHCCKDDRKGLCRLFPARRRTLPSKIQDLYEHVRRCTLCPAASRERLMQLKQPSEEDVNSRAREKEFLDRVWVRMGHSTAVGSKSGTD